MEDCPTCFGNKNSCGKLDNCCVCEFFDSCKYVSEDDGSKCDNRLGHVSYERYSYSEEIADYKDHELPVRLEDDESAKKILEFLIDIDNYSAELLSEVIHGNCSTASELAKRFGISRQAVHRKIVDCCTLHPELRKLFITRLYRCRRLLRDSNRFEKNKKRASNKREYQMEFQF